MEEFKIIYCRECGVIIKFTEELLSEYNDYVKYCPKECKVLEDYMNYLPSEPPSFTPICLKCMSQIEKEVDIQINENKKNKEDYDKQLLIIDENLSKEKSSSIADELSIERLMDDQRAVS